MGAVGQVERAFSSLLWLFILPASLTPPICSAQARPQVLKGRNVWCLGSAPVSAAHVHDLWAAQNRGELVKDCHGRFISHDCL